MKQRDANNVLSWQYLCNISSHMQQCRDNNATQHHMHHKIIPLLWAHNKVYEITKAIEYIATKSIENVNNGAKLCWQQCSGSAAALLWLTSIVSETEKSPVGVYWRHVFVPPPPPQRQTPSVTQIVVRSRIDKKCNSKVWHPIGRRRVAAYRNIGSPGFAPVSMKYTLSSCPKVELYSPHINNG